MHGGIRPCYSWRVSTLPSTALVRFCLVGFLAVARILCPCPGVEVAYAENRHQTAAHDCCHQPTNEKNAANNQAGQTHKDGCQHCGDSPRLTQPASGWAESPIKHPADSLLVPDLIRPTAAVIFASRRLRPTATCRPPLALWRIRTVVLLI